MFLFRRPGSACLSSCLSRAPFVSTFVSHSYHGQGERHSRPGSPLEDITVSHLAKAKNMEEVQQLISLRNKMSPLLLDCVVKKVVELKGVKAGFALVKHNKSYENSRPVLLYNLLLKIFVSGGPGGFPPGEEVFNMLLKAEGEAKQKGMSETRTQYPMPNYHTYSTMLNLCRT